MHCHCIPHSDVTVIQYWVVVGVQPFNSWVSCCILQCDSAGEVVRLSSSEGTTTMADPNVQCRKHCT